MDEKELDALELYAEHGQHTAADVLLLVAEVRRLRGVLRTQGSRADHDHNKLRQMRTVMRASARTFRSD